MPNPSHLLSRRSLLALPLIWSAMPLLAAPLSPPAPDWSLPGMDGTPISSRDLRGKVVLLVNTASLCGFTPQYDGLQALYEAWGPRGLVVVAVPSDDFSQEKDSNAEVKDFCELTFGLTMPMAEISHVKGPKAVPVYRWLDETLGFVPRWNFNKVLFDAEGRVVQTWGSTAEPRGGAIEEAIAGLLGQPA